MKNNANGISPMIAILLTLLVIFLTIMIFKGGHVFWGIVFTAICADFFADMMLSFCRK